MSKSLKKENKGSTLVLVMVAMALIGILGVSVISMTMTGIKIKSVDRQAGDNFYEAEAVMDEVKAKLEFCAMEQVSRAYQEYLSTYLNYNTEEERKNAFTNWCLYGVSASQVGEASRNSDGIVKALSGSQPGYYNAFLLKLKEASGGIPMFPDYYIDTSLREGTAVIDSSTGVADLFVDAVKGKVTLKNMRVSFTGNNGYETTITADLNVQVPELSGGFNMNAKNDKFREYSLIADVQLAAEQGMNNQTTGNVYAGEGGILIKAETSPGAGLTNYTLRGEQIVTRGDIKIVNVAKAAFGPNAGAMEKIWAKNMITERDAFDDSAVPTDMNNQNHLDITGICYIANDMKINKRYSTVTFFGDSEYYGYNYNKYNRSGGMASAEYSSAIFINGAKSTLNMAGLNKLTLAGHAFVSIDQQNGGIAAEFPTGESLTTKNTQLAYLVANKYITDPIAINPMPKSTYDSYTGKNIPLLKIDALKADSIYPYLVASNPIRVVFPALPNSVTPMAYCYYNFKSLKDANEYFKEYYGTNVAEIEERTGYYLTDDGIKIDMAGMDILRTAGNVLTYEANKTSLIPYKIDPDNAGSSNYLESNQIKLKYQNISSTLDENKAGNINSSVFASIIDMAKTNTLPSSVTSYESFEADKNGDGVADCGIYVVNNKGKGEFVVDGHIIKNGIVAVTGDVEIRSYEGVVLSGGTIRIRNSNVTTKADPDLVDYLLEEASRQKNPIIEYFNGYLSSGNYSGTGSSNMSEWVYYENWKKNGE